MDKPVSDQFLSSLFLVLKRDEKSRPVINLISQVRAFQNGRHSSSPRSASASGLAGENRFERCVLRDPNLEGSQEIPSIFLEGFSPGICMPPFGLAVAPRLFTKVLKPVVALPRRSGIRLIIIYLDDLLIMNQSKEGHNNNNNNNNNIYFNTIEFTAIPDVVVHLTI